RAERPRCATHTFRRAEDHARPIGQADARHADSVIRPKPSTTVRCAREPKNSHRGAKTPPSGLPVDQRTEEALTSAPPRGFDRPAATAWFLPPRAGPECRQ